MNNRATALYFYIFHIYSSKVDPSLFFFCSLSCLQCPSITLSLFCSAEASCTSCKCLRVHLKPTSPLFISKLTLSFSFCAFCYYVSLFFSYLLIFCRYTPPITSLYCSYHFSSFSLFIPLCANSLDFCLPVFCSEGYSVSCLPFTSLRLAFSSLFPVG